jgi:hypothetical protein
MKHSSILHGADQSDDATSAAIDPIKKGFQKHIRKKTIDLFVRQITRFE